MRHSCVLGASLAAGALLVASPSARAQTTPPITSNDYVLDLSQGPITTATRVIGLGGAYAALAEWCEGEYVNAASPAVRAPYSLKAFDYDVCLGFMAPGVLGSTDFENHAGAYPTAPSASRLKNALNVNAGVQLQFGSFGVTIDYDAMTFGVDTLSVGALTRTSSYAFRIDRVTGSAGWALFGGQFLVGAGLRTALSGSSAGTTSAAGGYQVGALYRPNLKPYRLGITYRDPVRITDVTGNPNERLPDGTQVAEGRILPSTIVLPLELEAGVAIDFGPRILNPEWLNPDDVDGPRRRQVAAARLARTAALEEEVERAPKGQREALRLRLVDEERKRVAEENAMLARERAATAAAFKKRSQLWPRRGITVLASVLVTGRTPNAVGISGFLLQRREPYGGFTTASPRFGFETEPIPHWLTVRGGTYLEPSRFEGGLGRVHLTAGADVATVPFTAWGVFNDNRWRIRLAVDGAPRYANIAIAIGQYH